MRTLLFRIYFVALLLFALCPPLYLSVSGSPVVLFGLPLPIAYWIGITVLAGVGVSLLYAAEYWQRTITEEESAR